MMKLLFSKLITISLAALLCAALLAGCLPEGELTQPPPSGATAAATPDSRGAAQATPTLNQQPAQTALPTLTAVPIAPPPTLAAGQAKILIGISFLDLAQEPWKTEAAELSTLLKSSGFEVAVQDALGEGDTQFGQIDGLTALGAQVIIVDAEDGINAAGAVDRAAAAGVKVIAYDRLVDTLELAAFITFDQAQAGRVQAEGLLKAAGIDSRDPAVSGKLRLVRLAGGADDFAAAQLRRGQDEILTRYKDKIDLLADDTLPELDRAEAARWMGETLTAQNKRIDAVLTGADVLALGALETLRSQNLAGVVAVAGLGASAEGCNSIARGELTLTVLLDRRGLPEQTVSLINQLLSGAAPAGLQPAALAVLANRPAAQGEINVLALPAAEITRDNLYPLVIKSFYQSYEDVYRDVPEVNRPPQP